MYERILVPVDGSAETRPAIEHAADLAVAHDATVHAVYVVNTASFAGVSMDTTWEGLTDVLRDEGEEAVELVVEICRERGVPVEETVLEGTPSREIVRQAERAGCDLIVMGTHGRGGIDRLLLGSVAERVVRSASVPVLTLRCAEDGENVARAGEPAGDESGESVDDASATGEDGGAGASVENGV